MRERREMRKEERGENRRKETSKLRECCESSIQSKLDLVRVAS